MDKKEFKIKTNLAKRLPFLKYFFWEAVFSLIIFYLGIIAAKNAYQSFEKENVIFPTYSMGQFLTLFLAGTIFILLIALFPKIKKIRGKIYKTIFIFSTAYGALMTISIIFSKIIPGTALSDLAALIIVFLIILGWIKKPTLISHNLLIGLGLAGIGGTLGLSFQPKTIMVILGILSIYDFIAVYKTKHMVKMAKSMAEAGAMMGLIIPSSPSELLESSKEIRPGERFFVLGGGDIALPLMFSVSLMPFGIERVIFVSVFSLLGIYAGFFLFSFQKEKRALPALPVIAFFSILGYIISLLYYN